jgi:Flp pilus assembly protein TadG
MRSGIARRTRSDRRSDQRGMISAYVAGMGAALLIVAGAVFDGGRFVNTYGEASDLAGNAARAAAQATDPDELYRTGTVQLDPVDANRRAVEFLDVANPDAAVAVEVDGNTVTVTVSLTSTPRILPIGTRTIKATATATAQRGVEQPSGAP